MLLSNESSFQENKHTAVFPFNNLAATDILSNVPHLIKEDVSVRESFRKMMLSRYKSAKPKQVVSFRSHVCMISNACKDDLSLAMRC